MSNQSRVMKVAALDDYANLATQMTDWSILEDRAAVTMLIDNFDPSSQEGTLPAAQMPPSSFSSDDLATEARKRFGRTSGAADRAFAL